MNRVERNKLVEENLRLVYKACHKYKEVSKEKYCFDELVSEGTIALIQAVDRFDVKKGFAFSTYAVATIDFALRAMIYRDKRYYVRVGDKEGGGFIPVYTEYLNDTIKSEGNTVEKVELLADDFNWDDMSDSIAINNELNKLSSEDKNILSDYYYKEMTQKEIASKLDISQVQVSRKLKKIMDLIKLDNIHMWKGN